MFTFDKILVPVDFGPHSDEAVRVAAALASGTGATVLLAHAYSADGEACPNGHGTLPPEECKRVVADLEHQMDARRIVLQEAGVRVATRLISGNASGEISRLARQGHFNLIVMGIQGRTALGLKRPGSVVQAVVREVSCALLVVHCPGINSSRVSAFQERSQLGAAESAKLSTH